MFDDLNNQGDKGQDEHPECNQKGEDLVSIHVYVPPEINTVAYGESL